MPRVSLRLIVLLRPVLAAMLLPAVQVSAQESPVTPPVLEEDADPVAPEPDAAPFESPLSLEDLIEPLPAEDVQETQDGRSIFSPGQDFDPSGSDTIEVIEGTGSSTRNQDKKQGPVEITDRTAVLRALEKVTARIEDLTVGLNETVQFKSLSITMRTCNKRPPEEPPETTAFLEIVDQPPNADPQSVFTGWMFASSPALNALEHPVYDVWVIDCKISNPVKPGGNL